MDSQKRTRNKAACRRCQRRKIRCDGSLPSCGSCQKVGVTCIKDGKVEVHRSYIANMENRIKWLESIVREKCSNIDLSRGPESQLEALNETVQREPSNESGEDYARHSQPQSQPSPRQRRETLAEDSPRRMVTRGQVASQLTPAVNEEPQQGHEIGLVSLSPGGDPRYIGPSSGYFFAKRILSSAGCRGTPRSATRPGWDLSRLPFELLNAPASLPPLKESAVELSMKYFRTVHLLYPFLHEQTHMAIIDRVYASQEERPLEIFQVYMVLAIAALNLSRQCKIQLPVEGYYASAMRYADYVCDHGSMAGLQCLLLLMVYALYNPSGNINIWNLNYQCLASVIDLGLQRDVRASASLQISVFDQEMRTRIFWVVYTFDRTVCTMMGRPIGIRDEACDIRFPLAISDCDLINIAPDQQIYDQSSSHMSYSVHLFKLARLNSEIKYVMHSINRDAPTYAFPPVRDILAWQQDMIKSLEYWLSAIPQQVNGVEGDMVLFCKVKYHETMILLLRPSPGIPNPSDDLLDLCFSHAVMLLQGFGDMYGVGNLLYSRLVVHSIFLGTMVLLYCIRKLPWIASRIHVNGLISKFNTSQNILSSIGEHWAEATRARDCVHELSTVTIRRLLETQPAVAATAQPNQTDPTYQHGETQRLEARPPQQQGRVEKSHGEATSEAPVHDNGEPWPLNQPHAAYEPTVSDFSNLFDDLLQGDFAGWSGMSDIDGLMWEVFNRTLQ